MAGYATLSPALAGGPPGWVVWAVGGTILTVGAVLVGSQALEMARSRDRAEPRVIPRTDACSASGTRQHCPNQRPYSVRVHAQGTDCGGTPRSTIGAPALSRQGSPITAGEGVALSIATWSLLSRTQRNTREMAKVSLEAFILARPPAGFLSKRSFPASDRRGGKRYDVDSFGPSANFIS